MRRKETYYFYFINVLLRQRMLLYKLKPKMPREEVEVGNLYLES
jgi:hypothetical protein